MPRKHHPLARALAALTLAALTLATAALAAAPAVAAADTAAAAAPAGGGRALPADTRFFTPPPASGSVQQIVRLARKGDLADAALLARMEATPQAVWLTGGTPAQVARQVRTTLAEAARERAVPVLVAYDIPGRDCAEYSAGGAADQTAYDAWISAVAKAIGNAHVVVIVEPDALGNMPSDCAVSGSGSYPFTDAQRIAEVGYAATALEAGPHTGVYLDGTNSHWQAVGNITQRLLEAGVQHTQGFFLNVSNYQSDAALTTYGTWVSDCIAMSTDPANWAYGKESDCAGQYYPATVDDPSTWALTTAWYQQNMGDAVADTHFVIDSSRNGQGANNMQTYAAAPYDQPSSVTSALFAGNWCNPSGAGLGLRPTADTGVPLLDAYLWIKTPGQSDGQCDSALGVRAWDYTAYTQPGWPTTAASQALFDPLWGIDDPAAGAWFPQQALQLAQKADPTLR
ncbi:glycoside hydrolase family 6 protein [Streptacidiphilus albus]|uniref:glycoside hydrolase family 6 protein n=1 Tax=Streptacidiphilus albus TaxID=105425 RepID=UPI0005A71387|nr:glycoside hydrolase family 6 protein [Streptacidiphilus albus]